MKHTEPGLNQAIRKIRASNKKANSEMLLKAFELAKQASPETMFHSKRISLILAGMGLGEETITAGILHNYLAGEGQKKEVLDFFGPETLKLLEELGKINNVLRENHGKISNSDLTKIVLAISTDIRPLFLKLSEQLAYLEKPVQGKGLDPASLALESQEIFTPIASKLGLRELTWELQDMSMKSLEPEAYHSIKRLVKDTRKKREKRLEGMTKTIRKELKKRKINAKIFGRVKSFYGIREKIIKKRKPFREIHDLIAARVICGSIKECYAVLAAIHELFEPVPGYFDDYISKPKPNGYRSIHTDVKLGKTGMLEVQIRTWEMHSEAEGGVAAHWQYKEFKQDKDFDSKLDWAKQLIEWSKEGSGRKNLLDSLKLDFEARKLFVLTPKGNVVELNSGSTPIDFAYAIHSDIGHHAERAKVNGKPVPFDHELQNGDVIEISTSIKQKPKRNWLQFVKTHKARNKIRAKLNIEHIAKKIKEKFLEIKPVERTPKKSAKVILSLCCNPVPGDEIIAYETTKRKIRVHQRDCVNARKLLNSNRLVSVEWDSIHGESFDITLKVRAMDRANLLRDLLDVITKNKASLLNTNANIVREKTVCSFSIKIKNKQRLENIMQDMRSLHGVHEVSRA